MRRLAFGRLEAYRQGVAEMGEHVDATGCLSIGRGRRSDIINDVHAVIWTLSPVRKLPNFLLPLSKRCAGRVTSTSASFALYESVISVIVHLSS